MRTYVHDNETLQLFFAALLNRLSSKEAYENIIVGILEDVCKHFRFGCGLIYEVNHADNLELTEHHTVYPGCNPPKLISSIDECLEHDSAEKLKNGQPITSLVKADGTSPAKDINLFFDSNSALLSPIIDPSSQLVGLVVLLDRRKEILLNDHSVNAVLMVLNILGNHIKTNIYRKRLELTTKMQLSILDNLGINVCVTDMDTHEVIFVNKPMSDAYKGSTKMIGKTCLKALQEIDANCECGFCPGFNNANHDKSDSGHVVSWEHKNPNDNSWYRFFSSTFRWLDGRRANVISSVDITENKQNEEIIRKLADYDQVTGLPNRRKFFKDCKHILENINTETKGHVYLLFFDLDKFKAVNDTLGHPAGDELLSQIGKTLLETPLISGRAYRYGGDEFVLLYEDVSRTRIIKVITFLLKLFGNPWELADGSPTCFASIGVAQFPDDTDDMEKLIYKADQAMYQAKQKGGNLAVFSDGEELRI